MDYLIRKQKENPPKDTRQEEKKKIARTPGPRRGYQLVVALLFVGHLEKSGPTWLFWCWLPTHPPNPLAGSEEKGPPRGPPWPCACLVWSTLSFSSPADAGLTAGRRRKTMRTAMMHELRGKTNEKNVLYSLNWPLKEHSSIMCSNLRASRFPAPR